ncbi:MAG: ribonuclease III [Planctomycetota bacterium]
MSEVRVIDIEDRPETETAPEGDASENARPALVSPEVVAESAGEGVDDDELIARAEGILGVRFEDRSLLSLALRHASHSDSRLDSNERLEFLGDAILGAVVCERIYDKFPDLLEGEMTKIKSSAVSRRTCARVASGLGLEDLLILGKGMQGQDRLPSSLAAAVLESVAGALYLDQGFAAAKAWLVKLLDPLIDQAARSGHQQNFKSVLQQHAQQFMDGPPTYRVLDEKGPDHAKAFKVAVELGAETYPASWGQSKKQAEQQAALHALTVLGILERREDGEIRLVSNGD